MAIAQSGNQMPMETFRPHLVKLEQLGAQLEKSEAKRQHILEFMKKAPCICFMKDAETGKYQFMNAAGLTALGKTEEEVIGFTDVDLLPEWAAKRLVEHDLRVLKEKEPTMVLEASAYAKKEAFYLVIKFLVQNGSTSIGGLAVELPGVFKLEPILEKM